MYFTGIQNKCMYLFVENRNVFRKIFITHTQCSKKYSVYNSQDYLAPNIGLKKLTETIF